MDFFSGKKDDDAKSDKNDKFNGNEAEEKERKMAAQAAGATTKEHKTFE